MPHTISGEQGCFCVSHRHPWLPLLSTVAKDLFEVTHARLHARFLSFLLQARRMSQLQKLPPYCDCLLQPRVVLPAVSTRSQK